MGMRIKYVLQFDSTGNPESLITLTPSLHVTLIEKLVETTGTTLGI